MVRPRLGIIKSISLHGYVGDEFIKFIAGVWSKILVEGRGEVLEVY